MRNIAHLEYIPMITEFSPFASLFGGGLIGASAVLLMLTLGRIMGATGILAGVIFPNSFPDWSLRAVMLVGMLCGPLVLRFLTGNTLEVAVPISPLMIVIGGFIVGIGVTLGSGCTSGHGVCGVARLSQRSIVAVIAFMTSTVITVFVVRHVLGITL